MCTENGSVATTPCRFHGEYDPIIHVVLYCEHCMRWYHRACIGIVGPLAGLQDEDPEILPAHLVFDEDADEVSARWQRLRAVPIQRGYPEQLGPGFTTFESILLAARQHGPDAPDDIDAFTRSQIAKESDEYIAKVIADLAKLENAAPETRIVYRCPNNHIL